LIKESFYNDAVCQLKIARNTIKKLLNTIKWHSDENELLEVIAELKEITDFSETQEYIDEVVESLSENLNICPICSSPLIPEIRFNIHTELSEGNNREEYMVYVCEECNYEDE
jgi:RNase P subunit RPR2